MTFSGFQGLHANKFALCLPWMASNVNHIAIEHGVLTAVREWSARGPPLFFL